MTFGGTTRGWRSAWLGLLAVLPVVAPLVLIAPSLLSAPERPLFPCPLYPNAVVSLSAIFYDTCPLDSNDRIQAITIEGRRSLVDSAADLRGRLRVESSATLEVRSGPAGLERQVEVAPVRMSPA